jgi:AcrR family transcriptional regulator
MSTGFHETKERLIQTTVQLIDELPFEQISSALVLERSGISKGSMYHFFEDFSDLLDAAYARRFAYLVKISADYIQTILDDSHSAKEFFEKLRLLTIRTQSRDRSSLRFERARMLARAERNERFRKTLGAIQQDLTDQMTHSIILGQEKGWITTKYEARTIAVFIQSYTLGRLIDEIVEKPMNDDDWNHMIDDIAEKVFADFEVEA